MRLKCPKCHEYCKSVYIKYTTWDYVKKKTKKRTWQTSKWVYCPKCREMHKPIIKF